MKIFKKHWKILTLVFVVPILAINFNIFLYLATRDPAVLTAALAQTTSVSMRFSAAPGAHTVGDSVTVAVLLSSPTRAMNAVEGEILFPTELLELIDISTRNSINTLWIPGPPYFSTSSNTIVFAGGMPNPGFEAVDGVVLTLTFKILAAGGAEISMSNLVVLANDGAGTELNSASQPIDIILQPEKTPAQKTAMTGDGNDDKKVDLSDMSVLVSRWGKAKASQSDLNGDGSVDATDMSILFSKMTAL